MNYRLDWKGWTFWQFPLFFEFPIDFLSKDRGMWLASEWKKGEVVVLLSYYFWGHSSRHSWPHFGENTKRFFIFLSWNSSRTKKHLKVTKSNFLNFFIFQAKIWKYLNFRAKILWLCQSHLYFGMEKIRLDISRTRFFSIHAKLQFWALARCLKITKKVSFLKKN